jgi:hypothetical protein
VKNIRIYNLFTRGCSHFGSDSPDRYRDSKFLRNEPRRHKDTKGSRNLLRVASCLSAFVVQNFKLSHYRHLFKLKQITSLFLFLFIIFFNSIKVSAQPGQPLDAAFHSKEIEPLPDDYDEILITLYVPRIGSIEIPAVIYKESAYLPVKELFDFLKIRNTLSPDFHFAEGFFIDPKATYTIDESKSQIMYGGKKFDFQSSDMIIAKSGLYLKSPLFGLVFGLDCQFNFRSLSVNLTTNIELPVIREMKLAAMHQNLSQLKGEKKADTTIKRTFSLFHLGMLDWSVLSTRELYFKSNTRITLGIGAMIAGGETDIFLNYYNDHPFKLKDQYYYWRYINNEFAPVRQVTLGKIMANPSSSVYNSIIGAQVSNTPTTYRRSFGTYNLSDKTEPGWTVELYVNDVLVNFTKADASGFFNFEVPMVYGNSVVKLRFYGPYGEERTHEQNLSIPFNFLPQHQFEYNLSAGVVEDDMKTKFSRAQFNYGLSKRITIGAGMEYLSSLSQKTMPFVNASVRLGSNLFITGEHIRNVRTKGLISYKLPANIRVELNYLRYDKNQNAIRMNYLEERKLVISKPFHNPKMSAFTRLTINQFRLSTFTKDSRYTSAELLLSAVAFGVSSNLTNYVIIKETGIPIAYSNLAMTFHLPHGINILPQAKYEYTFNKFTLLKGEVEKTLFKRGYLNLSYERDLKNKTYMIGIGLRYNLSFTQVAFSTRFAKQNIITNEQARGSLIYDGKTNYIGLNSMNQVGRGGLIVAPYLDLNCNGKRERDEPAAPGLKLKINGGHIKRIEKDTTIRVSELDAYTSYFVELDKNSFDNIGWQIRKPTIRINTDPNHFIYLEVPVSVVGEADGTVYLHGKNGNSGLGRIIVNIYNGDSIVARTITEADGYFSYIGLPPGNYTAKIDPNQLTKLNMQSLPAALPVIIRKTRDGDVVSGMGFTLSINDNKKE